MFNSIEEYIKILYKNNSLFSNENALIKIITDEKKLKSWMEAKKAQLAKAGKPDDWGTVGVVFNDPYILILRDLVEFPGGKIGTYFRILNQADLQGGQSVVVLAEMDQKYLLLHQYRHPIRSWSLEVPRGFGEPGVPPDQQAKTEIKEEVEGQIEELIDLGDYHSNTGSEASLVKLFFARLKSVGKPEIEEGIDNYIWISLGELESKIANGEILDGFTIAAYTRAKLRGLLD